MSLDVPDRLRFDEELDHAFQAVRGSLTQLLTSVAADPEHPQDIARRFRINKNLAWKLSKIVTVNDPHAIIANMPGIAGMNTILTAFENSGAPGHAVAAARAALDDFDRVVEVHVGDRSTLHLVLSSNAPHKVPQEQLHATRKMAYQGNSAIWGIQARVRFASFFLAPNAADPDMLDTASLGGLIDVRRLRPDVGTPLFMRFSYNDDGSIRTGPEAEPIEQGGVEPNPMLLMREFCSTPIPEFRALRDGSYTRFQLAPGPVGNRGRHTWVYGECCRSFASRYRDEHNSVGEHVAPVQIAAEWLLADLQVHRDLAFALDPRIIAYGLLGSGPGPGEDAAADRLPLAETIQSIGSAPPVVATTLVPRYTEMVERVYQRLDWNPRDFHGYRFVMKYPPMPAALVYQHDLDAP